MARSSCLPRLLGLICAFICIAAAAAAAASPRLISVAHRSASLELFVPIDGSFGSLEETYEALKTLHILGLEKNTEIIESTCPRVLENLRSEESSLSEMFDSLRVDNILGCQIEGETLEAVSSKLKAALKDANRLMDFYYSIKGLLYIKGKGPNVFLSDADSIFHSIKALSQSDGRWHYDSNGAESSIYAAGIALEALAGVVSLAESEVDQSEVGVVKNDIVKLFDSIKSYNDGTFYFDEKYVDTDEYRSPLTTSASVIRGVTAFAAVTSGKLNVPSDKILGLAKFFLSIGIPGSPKDFFNQMESLSCLENNRISIPLILSLPSTVLSLSSKEQLKVEVSTVFGYVAPPLTVKLLQAFSSGSKDAPVLENQELHFDSENAVHYLELVPLKIDVGKYTLVFEILIHDPENMNIYATGGQIREHVFVTGSIKIDKAEIALLESDGGSVETTHKLDLSRDNTLSLSANHLQKLRLSFQLTTPYSHTFKPHQVLLKLRHETKIEHVFVLEKSGRQFKIVLDFLGLVEKFYYLSGRYEIQLAVGDSLMENSFLTSLAYLELDLPEPPEKAVRPPVQQVDPYSRFGPKQEISHIFRSPEKRPPEQLSYVFLALTLLPLVGFLVGLIRLGVNLKGFPSSAAPAAFSTLFHICIAAVLLLYILFWVKLNLFTTLKALGLLGIFMVFVGHKTLSNLAKASGKIKSA